MSDAVKIELSPEAQALIARLGNAHVWVPTTIARTMQRENEFTIRDIRQFRFGGNNHIPFPVSEHKLGNRSNRLRGSLDAPLPVISGQTVTSSIGTNVEYAAAHEFGNHDTVTVPAHTRRRKRTVTVERTDSLGKRRKVRKRVRGDSFAVRSYSMKMNIAARAPITTGVAERLPALGEAMSRDIVIAFGERGMV